MLLDILDLTKRNLEELSLKSLISAVICLLLSVPAIAQTDTKKRFDRIIETVVGGEWENHTRLYAPDGSVYFEGRDIRIFRIGVGEKYLIEETYGLLENGDRRHVGISLSVYNEETDAVHISGYWPWTATQSAEVEAHIEETQDGTLTLTGPHTVEVPGQANQNHENICYYTSTKMFECDTMTQKADGSWYRAVHGVWTRKELP